MSDLEEVERYRKLLEDWNVGDDSTAKSRGRGRNVPSRPARSPRGSARSGQRDPEASSLPSSFGDAAGDYSQGAILVLNQRTLAIYDRAVPQKEYDLLYILFPNGSVKRKSVALKDYEVQEIGSLPPKWHKRLHNGMQWSRDLIVFHCYRFEDVAKLPVNNGSLAKTPPEPASAPASPAGGTTDASVADAPEPEAESPEDPQETSPPEPQPTAAPKTPSKETLHRGQRIRIQFGDHAWDAIYWGEDKQGTVVAHKTYETWSLMHLDLSRFQDELVIDPEIDQNLVEEIHRTLYENQTQDEE